jgi:DNA cross-link repair 1A protein
VSVANDGLCSPCKQKYGAPSPPIAIDLTNNDDNNNDNTFEPNTKRPRVVEKSKLIDLSILNDDDNDECSEDDEGGAGSEGEDDIHCTQILTDNEENENDCGKEGAELPGNFPPESTAETSEISLVNTVASPQHLNTVNSNDDICFICGVDLTKLKRRVDHIKRCSKKHCITGRDVKVNNDHEEFVAPIAPTNSSKFNPYVNKENAWHGDSTHALQQASNDNTTKPQHEATNTTTATIQTSLSSFFEAPVRSMNNVLLAGARRISKATEVATMQKSKDAASKPSKKGLFGRRDYPKVRAIQVVDINSTLVNPQLTPLLSVFQKSCPMYKRIPGTDFVCDGFHYAKWYDEYMSYIPEVTAGSPYYVFSSFTSCSANTTNHFLTHFHADHYGGITSSWSHGTIYCSLPTANLVGQQLGVDKKYIHPLPMFTPTVVGSKGKPITVTLLDANHCPGAIMFLFEVGKKKILHVGDFRWNREIMMQQAPLRALRKTTLDELFLDTTYCNPKYSLPSQAETIQATIRIFEEEMKHKDKTLHLFGAYTIGKEKIYLSVASKFGMKVYVDSRRYRILSALQWPKERMDLLTKRKEDASIWVVPLGDINFKKMPEYLPAANSKPFSFPFKRVVGYRPTGWSMSSKPGASTVSTRQSGNLVVHSVPYSEHSSFPELLDCLDCLKPQRIVPTVSVSKSDEQVALLLTSLREKQTTLKFAK